MKGWKIVLERKRRRRSSVREVYHGCEGARVGGIAVAEGGVEWEDEEG